MLTKVILADCYVGFIWKTKLALAFEKDNRFTDLKTKPNRKRWGNICRDLESEQAADKHLRFLWCLLLLVAWQRRPNWPGPHEAQSFSPSSFSLIISWSYARGSTWGALISCTQIWTQLNGKAASAAMDTTGNNKNNTAANLEHRPPSEVPGPKSTEPHGLIKVWIMASWREDATEHWPLLDWSDDLLY